MILSYVRTAVLYLVLILSIRLMGKRQIGQMEASEFVVTMLVANLASIPMQDAGIPLYSGLVPILIVLGMELSLSGLLMRSVTLRRFFCGKPVILMEKGKILEDNLRRTRVTLDELVAHLRQKEVLDLTSVQYAILETDGSLSVFLFPDARPATAREAGIQAQPELLPLTLIQDGQVMQKNLILSGKDSLWLEEELLRRQTSAKETLLLTVDEGGRVLWMGKEGL